MDGTFDIAKPTLFVQLFMINVVIDGTFRYAWTQNVTNHIMIKDCFLDHSIPVLWALLTRKTTKAYYDGVFEPLRRMMEERVAGAAYFENKAVVVDFELAISAALRAAFPNFR